jgi:outer membrane protein OmpA-like peptidoglycan-associated protein
MLKRKELSLLALFVSIGALGLSSGCANFWNCKKTEPVAAAPVPPPAPTPPPPSCLAQNANTAVSNLTNVYVVSSGDLAALKSVASCLTQNPSARVRIEGHADYRGSMAYNQKLSQKRANAARDALVANGVNPANIDVQAYGETKPVAMGKDPASLAQNRQTFVLIVQ